MTNSSVCGWLSQGALALALLAVAEPLTAQIIPDRTLPSNSRVNLPGCVNCVIEGGTLRGVNLFHSFQEFSIPTGGSAYFNNPSRVENILTRVTGTSLSHIDGLLKANGTANFFLLNPNGILLGANARLELGGSFFVSAADRFQFSDGSEFSATHPQAPPLLTVNLTPGLQVGQRTAAVQNRANLTVAPGQSLTLLGQTTTSSGHLSAAGGRVELLGDRVALLDHAQIDVSGPTGGGVVLIGGDYRGQGTVPTAQQTFVSPLAQINADASLSGDGGKVIVWAEQTTRFFGSISARGGRTGGNGGLVEVSGKDTLNFQGIVDTSAPLGQQGILLLDPANITITNAASPIPPVNTLDGIWSAVEDPGDQTISPAAIATLLSFNNLTLEASNAIVLADSLFLNSTNDLTLRAGQIRNYTLDATGFATFLNTSIVQTGGGDLILETTAPLGDGFVAFVGGGLFNRGTTANGQGGNIRIRTNTLLVLAPEGGFTGISADTFGVANAGDVVINADSTILSGNVIVSSNVEAGAIGQGGIVSIQGGNLSVVNGANVQALLRGQENGFSGAVGIPGQVNVDVTGDVRVSGVNPAGFNSRLASDIGVGAVSISGLGGEINVTAGREIRVEDGALLTTITFANAGIGGRGSAGNINLTANDVIVAEAGVSSVIAADATGDAGNINITAGQLLSVTNGTIASNNASNGRAGNVNVQAPETQPPGSALAVVLDGSEITSSSNGANSGNSGTIAITANTVQLVNNARLRTSAVNPNAASGDIRIEAVGEGVPPVDGSTFVATPQILVRNSEIDSRSNNDSDPDFRFSTVSLRAPNGSILLDQATLNSQNTGASRFAGDIILNARDQIGISQSSIQSDGFFGRIFLGSDLSSILSPQFILVDASQITATNDTIGGTNRSGNATGDAGNINITAGQLLSVTNGTIASNNASNGRAGNVTVQAPETQPPGSTLAVVLDGSEITSSSNGANSGNSGTIAITANTVQLVNNARLRTSAVNPNAASGDIRIEAVGEGVPPVDGSTFVVTPQILVRNSEIDSRSNNDSDPDFRFSTVSLRAPNGSILLDQATLNSQNTGASRFAGDIILNARDQIGISQSSIQSDGFFGRIFLGSDLSSILSPQFILVDASQITATNDTIGGTNRSGNIRVSAISQVTLRNNSQLSIETVGDGIGGELTIDTGTLNVLSGTRVSASTAGAGAAGLIEITATEQIEISGIGSAIVANTRDTVQQATGQTVTEIGNAGQTLATAQNATGTGGGFITSIIGAIADANDVDLYQIFLGGGQTFSASTVGGASFDTQLFLFDAEGRGVYANDDASGTLQSILPAGSAFTPTNPGIYFLGVSSYNNDPQSIGGAIFSGGASEIAVPTGPGGGDPLIGWNSASTGSFGVYTITLTGTGSGQQTIIPGGRGGNITLTTDRLNVRTGASISSSTFGSGQGGAADIQANQLTLDNTGSINEPTGIFARTEGAGDAGRLTLQPRDAQSLSVTFQNGAEISTTTSGTGAGGFFSISAPESINLSGAGTLSADTSGAGIGGVLSIATGTLSIADGSRVSATATATATADAIGGDLIVSANTLSVSGATSGLFAETLGAANAGNLSLQPRDATSGLTVRFADGARISAATAGSGAGGGLFIQAIEQTVTLMGQGIVSVDTRGPGTGGDLLIDANRLELVDRAKLSASTSGEGDAGLIRITAPGGIRLDGAGTSILADTTDFVPPLVGQTFVEIGNAGQTLDTAQNATGAAGGFVSTIVGSLIDANDVDLYQIFLGGGQTFSASTVGGASFDTQLFLFDAEGRGVYANDDASSTLQSTLPAGSAFTPTNPGIYYLGISSFNNDPVSANGTIFLGSPTEVTPANGPGANNPLSGWNGFGGSFGDYIISLTGTGGQQSTLRGGLGGRIELNTSTLTLENQALISSSTSGSNDGGAIAINATTSVQASGGSTLRARATGTGNAGSLIITTPQLGLLGSEASVSNAGRGDAGTLAIAASQVVLQNDARLTATTETGSGQGITLTGLNSLQVLNSLISASTVDGVAGGVTVDASGGSVLLSGTLPNGRPGGIEIAATGAGEAGFLSITTSQLTFENGAGVSANNQSSLASSQILLNSLDTFIVRNTRLTASTQDGNAGSFLVNAANSVLVTGTAPDGRPAGIFVESIGTGAAGFLGITTAQLQVAEGAQVSVSNRGVGFGGGLTVNAQNIILNDGQLTAETFAGSGGNITLTGLNPTTPLEILQLSNQSQVSASTAIGGQGGDVSINTRQAVLLTGGSRLAAEATAGGNAGGVAVTTNLFAIDNSQVTVSSRGTGQAGNLEVTAQRVQLGNQSLLAATTEAGSGGNISFSGLNSLLLINSLINASTQSGTAGNVTIRANDSVTLRGNLLTGAGGISVAATEPGGTAGELNIRTGRFVVDNTQVSVSSPFGTAGNLSVLATSIQLERGRLSAFNGAGEGGNILLDLDGRFLFLRNESLIEAEAGGNANGGNIRIDVPNGFIIAFPFENSDITANAVAGRGGVIEINTQALFGIEFRPRRTPLSDITANSQTGADGTVQVNTLGIDPSRGLVALPVTLTDPTSQVAQSCSAQRRLNNRFVVTGRGGLPNSPEDSLSGLQTQVELLEPFDAAPSSHRQGAIAPLEHEIGNAETRIVEAQGWVKTPDGAIALVAETNTPSSKRDWQPTGECEGVSD